MEHLLHREDEDDRDFSRGSGDREITLGSTLILGIFFALAILCAVFFGLGYSLGNKRAATVAGLAAAPGSSGQTLASSKPSSGSPFAPATAAKPTGETINVPYTPPASAPPVAERPAVDEPSGETPPAVVRTTTPPSATAANVLPAGAAGAMVQVAAVSHQEDADLLVSTLKRRGYSVAIHQEPQDKLLHVQIGPFGSRKDADVMRQRLLTDGFNAIVK